MTAIHILTCDGCDNEIDVDEVWYGLDRFDPDDDDDPADDSDYIWHFCSARCVARRMDRGDL